MYADTHVGRTHTYDALVLVEVSLDETKTKARKCTMKKFISMMAGKRGRAICEI